MPKLIMVRHGQSVWNLQNRFTGWVDVPLSPKGIREAKSAGRKLATAKIDVIYVSHMLRSTQTLDLMLPYRKDKRTAMIHHPKGMIRNISWEKYTGNPKEELPIYMADDLAERYYGKLQGLNKAETAKKFGKKRVHLWRRSYTVRPPGGESLRDTLQRTLPYYKKFVLKDLKAGKNVLVVAHGNSLRAIIKHIEHISDKDIPNVEIPTGVPIVYTFDRQMKLLKKQVL